MKKKSLLVTLLVLCMMLVFTACNTNEKPKAPEATTRTIVDTSGVEVEIPMEVNKIVDAWPAHNSVMLLMGAGDRLVGTTNATINNEWSSLLYPEISKLPTDFENIEDIIALNPDLYICSDDDMAENGREAGIPAVNLYFSDYADMKESFKILGEILGGEYVEKADHWAKYVDEWTAEINKTLKDVPESERPILYYASTQSDGKLLTTFKSPSICKSWTNISGCTYMNDTMPDPSVTEYTAEELLKIDPDVIVVGGIHQKEGWENLTTNPVWAELSAVKNDRIFLAPMGMFSWCRFGMESAMMLPWLSSNVYPDLFPDVDMHKIVFDFYKEFAGVELTDAQIENMLVGYPPNDPYGATAVAKK